MELRSAEKTIELLAVLLAVSACGGEAFSLRTDRDGGRGGTRGTIEPEAGGGGGSGGSGGRTPVMGMIDFGNGGHAGATVSRDAGTGGGGAVAGGGGVQGKGGGPIDAGAGGNPGPCDSCDGGECGSGETRCEGTCVDLSDDPTNCGQCGHACGGGKCSKGACEPWVVASEPVIGRVQMASDGAYLAWTNDIYGVSVIPVSGLANGSARKVLSGGAAGALTIAEKKVVWFSNDASNKKTKLWLADEVGGKPASSSPPLATGGAAQTMAVASGFGVAYLGDAADNPPGMDVFSCTPVGPDAVCTKVQSVAGRNAGLSPIMATAFALTESNSYLFFGGTTFSRLDLVTGDVTQLVAGLGASVYQAAVADGQDVFWMDAVKHDDFSTDFTIQKCLHRFVNPFTVVDGLKGTDLVGAMTADNAFIYFVSANDVVVDPPTYIASIAKSNMYPGRPKILHSTSATIVAIVSAGGAVYWAEKGHDTPPTLTIYGQVFI